MFIPAGLEQHEAGSPLSPRLQPVIILEPSVTHAPLVAGKSQALGLAARCGALLGVQVAGFPLFLHKLETRR